MIEQCSLGKLVILIRTYLDCRSNGQEQLQSNECRQKQAKDYR
jgi:hypothetical protein